ncbi:unnamed protein product [Effrenium voratum]|nr:unnamed protein product [Effrenium voratum]
MPVPVLRAPRARDGRRRPFLPQSTRAKAVAALCALGLGWCFAMGGKPTSRRAVAEDVRIGTGAARPAEAVGFEPREVGSSEQLMLSRMTEGHMITTHVSMAFLEGVVDPQHLEKALRWAILRHPMLRATAAAPEKIAQDTGPFFHGGQDGRWTWQPSGLSKEELASRALVVEEVKGNFEDACQQKFEEALDKSTFDFEQGPLWRVQLLRQGGFRGPMGGKSTLVLSFVHSIDDQKSANILLNDLLSYMDKSDQGEVADPEPLALPASLEEVFLKEELDIQKLAGYAKWQAEAGGVPFIKVPSALRQAQREVRKNFALTPQQPVAQERPMAVPKQPSFGDAKLLLQEVVSNQSEFWSTNRRNIASFRTLPEEHVSALRQICRDNNVTMSMAVATAALLAASDVGSDDLDFAYEAYRLLLGVDMRRFAPDGDWTQGTLAYASGALDFTLRLLPKSGEAFAQEHGNQSLRSRVGGVPFWDLARAAASAIRAWVQKGYAAESTRLFDYGIKFLRMDNIIRETANDPSNLGRAYSVTVSNAGVFGLGPQKGRYGKLRLDKVFFGISTAVSGSMVSASCLTVNGNFQLTAHSASPIMNRSDLEAFSDSMIRSLTIAASEKVRHGSRERASAGTGG